jgi:hypothetical protein
MFFPQKDIVESRVYLTNITKHLMIEIEEIKRVTLLAFTSKAKSIILFRELSKAFKIKSM